MRATTLVLAATLALMVGATLSVASRWRNEPTEPEPRLVDFRIDINTADTPTLAALPGLGPKTAARVVEHRQAHGPFGTIDDLQNVKGIGVVTLEKLRPFARCSRPE